MTVFAREMFFQTWALVLEQLWARSDIQVLTGVGYCLLRPQRNTAEEMKLFPCLKRYIPHIAVFDVPIFKSTVWHYSCKDKQIIYSVFCMNNISIRVNLVLLLPTWINFNPGMDR